MSLALGGVACPAGSPAHREDFQGSDLPATDEPHHSARVARTFPGPQSGEEASVVAISADDLFRLVRNGARRGTVVNMWATWCAPCRWELPALKAETERFAAEGIALLVVSVDEESDQSKIPSVLSQVGIGPPYYVVRPPAEAFKRAVHPEWAGNLPVSFLFEAGGKRRFFWEGPVTTRVLRPILEEFVTEDHQTRSVPKP